MYMYVFVHNKYNNGTILGTFLMRTCVYEYIYIYIHIHIHIMGIQWFSMGYAMFMWFTLRCLQTRQLKLVRNIFRFVSGIVWASIGIPWGIAILSSSSDDVFVVFFLHYVCAYDSLCSDHKSIALPWAMDGIYYPAGIRAWYVQVCKSSYWRLGNYLVVIL